MTADPYVNQNLSKNPRVSSCSDSVSKMKFRDGSVNTGRRV